jgi:signal transduction histidine kinase
MHAMSHELRTPLNAVIGFSEMIDKEIAGPINNSTYAEFVKLIHGGGKHLLSVVNDVLDLTRLESGDIDPEMEAVGLSQLLDGIVEDHQNNLAESRKQIAVEVPPELELRIDRRHFTIVIRHLLSNALKFTRPGGHISITARALAHGEAVVEVRDDGVGVAESELPKLAEAFYQSDPSLSRAHGGTGLGLFLVTKYLALQGARLELESKLGEGFCARIHLPDAVVQARPSSPLAIVA